MILQASRIFISRGVRPLSGRMLTERFKAAPRLNSPSLGLLSARCLSISHVRCEASVPVEAIPIIATSAQAQQATEAIPELTIAQLAEGLSSDLITAAGGTPTLQDLGLGGWSPSGMVQQLLDILHSSTGMPWWATIISVTIVMKTLVFPLVIKGQRHAINMNNNLPEMQKLQVKMTEARQTGNQLESARAANDLVKFMQDRQINPFKGMVPPLIQAPIFISFFFALRSLANLPLESFKTEGAFWFVDLTVADPLYILPVITSLTLAATIELGAEGGVRADSTQWMKYALRAIPILIFPFTLNFPAAILCYWCASNTFSLAQVAFLRIETVRTRFNLPQRVKHSKEKLPLSKKTFVQGVKDSFTNQKITKEIEQRSRADEIRFKQAGMGPVVKTYKYDPTKTPPEVVAAKK